jgi:DNA-binding CsgD family transcriptional regulator/sugar-specific transcriptional regulator TrmB
VLAALGLDAVQEFVYRHLLDHDDWGVDDLAGHLRLTGDQVRAALDGLSRMALLRESAAAPGRVHAVDPEVALNHALARQQAELARRQKQVAESQASIARLIEDAGPRRLGTTSSATEIVGLAAVHDRLAQLADETRFEVLKFMSGDRDRDSAVSQEQAHRNDERLLHRRVRLRTIGLASIRNDPATMAHARFLAGSGAEFRTSPTLPPGMTVIDRRIALVPLDPSNANAGALCLTTPGAVASLLALFEQVWSAATPLDAPEDRDRKGLSAPERALLSLLGEGRTDEAAAARLGISARTARRMMADLMDRLHATSRFEAGLKAAQQGWL